jgi:hypothetical protein
MLPPPAHNEFESEGRLPDWVHANNVTERVGPDFKELTEWILNACGKDDEFFDEMEEQEGGGPMYTKQTDKVLPEGLFDATNYAWLMHAFRAGWIRRFMSLAFKDLEKLWKEWIQNDLDSGSLLGRGSSWVFDEEGMFEFQKMLRKQIDPWANVDGPHVVRM